MGKNCEPEKLLGCDIVVPHILNGLIIMTLTLLTDQYTITSIMFPTVVTTHIAQDMSGSNISARALS